MNDFAPVILFVITVLAGLAWFVHSTRQACREIDALREAIEARYWENLHRLVEGKEPLPYPREARAEDPDHA